MANFSATDVKKLRDMTGAGMMDAKKALDEADGDFSAATDILRTKGAAKAAKRGAERTASAGLVAHAPGVLLELKCETDFVAKSADFVNLANELAALVAAKGEDAAKDRSDAIDDLKVTLKENIELGRVIRFEPAAGHAIDTYLHVQSDRGVNGVVVELDGGSQELAHDIAVHIAFGKPEFLTRDEAPADKVAAEKEVFEAEARNSGKPEQAMPKIVEGKLNGWYKERVLLEQAYAKDDKQSVQQVLGDAKIVRFAQVIVGA
jgi:elongation factor Ts